MVIADNIKQRIETLLEQPQLVERADAEVLKEAIQVYPYMQALHFLLAKIDPQHVAQAALYSQGTKLYDFVHHSLFQDSPVVLEESLKDAEPEIFEEIADLSQLPNPESKKEVFIEPITAIDFFAFEQTKPIENLPQAAPEIETVIPDEPEHQPLSKYDDEELPYSFLWWLSRTRKAHAHIYQPYSPKNQQTATAQAKPEQPLKAFEQQYVEHIFHMQTPFDVQDHLSSEKAPGHEKEVQIIDKFLKEDPQIRPLRPEQIDNENKAKKSAEDNYDLVSETLAKIYIEQMLYHKAIDTYKKLSLKFPEKSSYFADLIHSIEKKI